MRTFLRHMAQRHQIKSKFKEFFFLCIESNKID